MKTQLHESYDFLEASEVSTGVYEVTMITEGLTKDGRRNYSRKVLQAAAPLFEGVQAYIDHPTESELKDRPERSIRDLAGVYSNTYGLAEAQSPFKVKSRLHTHEAATWVRSLLDMATDHPEMCGLSIHAEGEITPGDDGVDLVESIDKVVSVDIVTRPNAGGAVERLIASIRDEGGEEMDYSKISIEGLKKERPDLVEALIPKVEEVKPKEQTKETDEAKEALVKALAEAKVTASGILDKAAEDKRESVKTELFTSLEGKTPEEMDKLIESRLAFVTTVNPPIEDLPPKDGDKPKHVYGSILPEAAGAARKLVEVA